MPGARCTRGLVCKSEKKAHEHAGSAEASDIPCAMILAFGRARTRLSARTPDFIYLNRAS
jgi:hypothetical protein